MLAVCAARVHEPFEDTGEGAKTATTQGPGWAYRVARSDVQATRDCAAIFAVWCTTRLRSKLAQKTCVGKGQTCPAILGGCAGVDFALS